MAGQAWHTSPVVHASAGTLVGCAVGLADGLLATQRSGLESLSGSETAAALYLGLGLNGLAGLALGALIGVSYWALTRRVDPAALGGLIFGRRGRITLGALGLVAVAGVLLYAQMRDIEWAAIDWRAPLLVLAWLVGHPALVWAQRRRTVFIGTSALAVVVFAVVFAGWPATGDARDEGLIRIGTESATSKHLLVQARRAFDGDGDTFPSMLCRLDCDCDDTDPQIFPGGTDLPGNGIDEDCDGHDLSLADQARFEAMLGHAASPSPPVAVSAREASQGAPPEVAPEVPGVPPWRGLTLTRLGPPNFVFVLIDTLRRDHLGFAGYHRATSPQLDALAARAVDFTQTRATGPQTRFSVPPMLTSKYFTELDRTPTSWPRIGESELLLAERLKSAGYHTAAVQSVPYFGELYGFDQGFDHYDTTALKARHPVQHTPTADYVTDRMLEYVDSEPFKAVKAPFFLWAYYNDPHSEYLFHKEFTKFGPTRPDVYDNEIQFTDHHVGRLLSGLEERGLLEDTVVIVTSDHGEGLDPAQDHGHRYHGPTLYDEVMRVPLLVQGPGWAPQKVDTPVSLIDFTPTITELAGLPADASYRGVSLVPYLIGERPPHPPLFFEKEKEDALPQKGMVQWPYKVILVMPYNRVKIYDLAADPRERNDLRTTLPEEQREALVGLLRYWSSQVLKTKEPIPRP